METVDVHELALLRGARHDLEWFGAHYQNLLKAHNNEFVAIKNSKIIAANPKLEELLAKIEKLGYNPIETLIKYVTNAYSVLY